MQHIIKRQTIDLVIDKKLDAFRMQQYMSGHYWKDIVPTLDKLFTELTHDDEAIIIDKLEINIGTISEKEISSSGLSKTTVENICNEVRKIFAEAFVIQPERSRASVNICRQWLSYIQTGLLPWNTVKTDNNWLTKVLEALSIDFSSVTKLRNLLVSDGAALKRIALQHSDAFLINLSGILSAQNQQQTGQLINEIYKLFKAANHSKLMKLFIKGRREEIWQKTLLACAAHSNKATTELLGHLLINSFINTTVSERNQTEIDFNNKYPVIHEQLIITTENSVNTTNDIPSSLPFLDKPLQTPDSVVLEEEGAFVQAAGLVLLHPFLSSFFTRLKLVKNGRFKNHNTRQKSLHLLYYLISGNTTPEEHELAVAKVLCGWPLSLPVEKYIRLNKKEKDEANNLLVELIRNWSKLGNTTVTGLREGFLRRPGKIMMKNNQYYLQVESNAIDVLLDHLPWGIGIIKLPWMKEMLRVEWR